MSVLPIVTVAKLTPLEGLSNGQLPSDQLRQVGPSGFLHYVAARAFLALVAAAGKAGIPLTYTYGGCYRSYEQQVKLFLSRYTPTYNADTCLSRGKVWNGKWYWQLKGTAVAAVPGTSNHGWGLAIDLALDREPEDGLDPADAVYIGPALDWLITNAPLFGFSWELQSEPWHIRYVAGDHVPQKVLETEGAILVSPVTSDPAPIEWDPANGHYALWPFNDNKPVIFAGCQPGDVVKYLQGVLKNKAGKPDLVVDGIFGRQTDQAVRDLQAFCKLTVDGRVGRQTWGLIDYLATH
jgi:hypothetical protein